MNAGDHPEASETRGARRKRIEEVRRERERALARGLEEPFPASDPVAVLQPSVAAGRGEH
jgi:hypothetical protein